MKNNFSINGLAFNNENNFKTWLAAQPDDREFVFCDLKNCVIASYTKEYFGIKDVSCGGVGITIWEDRENKKFFDIDFNKFFLDLSVFLSQHKKFTIKQVKDYINSLPPAE